MHQTGPARLQTDAFLFPLHFKAGWHFLDCLCRCYGTGLPNPNHLLVVSCLHSPTHNLDLGQLIEHQLQQVFALILLTDLSGCLDGTTSIGSLTVHAPMDRSWHCGTPVGPFLLTIQLSQHILRSSCAHPQKSNMAFRLFLDELAHQ